MTGRRRPIALLFTVLLAAFTAATSVRAAHAGPSSLRERAGEGISTPQIPALRIAVITPDAPRRPVVHQGDSALVSPLAASASTMPAVRNALVLHSDARQAELPTSTYDATAPPRTR